VLRFNDILDRMLEYHPGLDVALLQRAYVFSAKVHEGQERLSGEPYLIHPLEVAGILVDMRLDDLTVAAGLLHDTVEDTLTTIEEIERLFGEHVAFLVSGLTKIARIEFTSHTERQAENFRKMLLAMSKDIRILLIKLADRLHNMRTLQFADDDSRRRIAQETVEIYAPLAHRLGIYWMKQELEALAFRALRPELVEELERRLRGSREQRERYIEEVIGVLSAKLAAAGMRAEVTGRVKDLHSIHAKMERDGIDLDQIYDVIAFRTVIEGPPEHCYQALGLIHNTWRPVPGRFKDYVALPKPNGYQSLHTAVIGAYGERMEIQIRTAEMHRNAELGIAAHWKYKEGRLEVDAEAESTFAWLRQLLEWQRDLHDPHEFIDAVKIDLFPDEVFVFTPQGDVINLPKRATPIDFAFAIHSEVGNHCARARVNGKMVPLRHVLHDGDTVEIQTSPNQFPRKDWLEFAVSSKARNRIRQAIRRAENERSRELGRDLLERELRRAKLSLPKLLESGELAELARTEARGGGVEELFSAVGYGRLPAATLVRRLLGAEAAAPAPAPEPETPPTRLASFFRRQKRASPGSGIRIGGNADVLVRFARCCSPLPGDEVVGFVTRGRGVTVHARDCAKAFEADPDRRIEVEWDDAASVLRRIRIRVRSKDQPGILAKVTKSISSAGINIGAARIDTTSDRQAVQSFDLWVADRSTLNALMKQIEKVKGVLSVERVRT
jgi:GTP pyrophosphokinase